MDSATTQKPGQTELDVAKVIASLAKIVMKTRLKLALANGVVQQGAQIKESYHLSSDVIANSVERGRLIAEETIRPLCESLHAAATADLAASLGEHHEVVKRILAANEALREIGGLFIPTDNQRRFYLVTAELEDVLEPLQDVFTRARFELELRAHELPNAAELAEGPTIRDGGAGQFIGQ